MWGDKAEEISEYTPIEHILRLVSFSTSKTNEAQQSLTAGFGNLDV